MKTYKVILTGTDPKSKKGGIGFALPGYISSLENTEIKTVSIPTYSPSSFTGKHFLFLKAFPKIYQLIKASKKDGKGCIIYSHAGAGISLFREGIITIFSKIFGAKTIMQIHSPETNDYLNSCYKKTFFKLALIGVDHIFVLTPWWEKTYLKMGIKKPLDCIPNPLPSNWEKRAHESTPLHDNDEIKVLVLSRIVAGKGADLVVEATPFLDDTIQVHIAGAGSLLETLKKRVKQLNTSNLITFHGWVEGEKKQELINNADILCHPTKLDAMPMTILEAMANGLPIVALDWGPISDLVPNQKAGILIKDVDPRKLANAIKKFKDPELRQKMGMEGKQWVLENYTSEQIGKKLQKIFSDMINK